MRHVALQVIIDRNVTPFGLNPSGFQIERLDIPRPASCEEDRSDVQTVWMPLLAIVQPDTAIRLFQALCLGTRNNCHMLFAEGFCKSERDILIFLWKKPGSKLKQVYLAAEILKDRRQLAASGCATDNRDAGWQLCE